MIDVLLVAALKGALVLVVMAEGALVLDSQILLALAGVPAVTVMAYATGLHVSRQGRRGTKKE